MEIVNPHLLILPLSVYGFSSPIKRCRVADGYKRRSSSRLCTTHFRFKDTHRLKMKCKKIFCANDNQNTVGVYAHIRQNRQ